MKVIVAEKCGFCPGVRNAIREATKILALHRVGCGAGVYSLGPIIHNKDVVEKLAKMGLKTVEKRDQIPSRTNLLRRCDPLRRRASEASSTASRRATVIIRSHGLAPKEKEKLEKAGLNIVDATCVLVKRVQKIAKDLDKQGYKVVVIGDKEHPEIRAVVGSARSVVVVADESDLHKLPKNGKLGVVCQTTQSPEHFAKMLDAIAKTGFTSGKISELKVINTLCREAIKRQRAAVKLCKKVDIMFVLGSLESANTRKLAELCKKYNKQTFHLQNWSEFDKYTCLGRKGAKAKTAGVTAGASTPEWIIKEFVENLTRCDASRRVAGSS